MRLFLCVQGVFPLLILPQNSTHMESVKNLLIDLGGVLYQIDIQGTLDRYHAMQAPGARRISFSKSEQHEVFSQLDCGTIEIDTFAQTLKDDYQLTGTLAEIKQIWMDLLIGVFKGREAQIKHLAKSYNLALLSNTSRYHFEYYAPQCAGMFEVMDHVFTSFDLGVRKPDAIIYETALRKAGWKAEETLFLDDSRTNIDAAASFGLQTFWVEQPADFESFMQQAGVTTS